MQTYFNLKMQKIQNKAISTQIIIEVYYEQQIQMEENLFAQLTKLTDPEYTLFSHQLNPDIKIQHRVEFQANQLIIHQDQFSTFRFNQIMKLVKKDTDSQNGGKNSEDFEDEVMRDRLWEQQYMKEVQRESQEQQEENSWQTEQQEENYLQSPSKGVGVMVVQSDHEPKKDDHEDHQ